MEVADLILSFLTPNTAYAGLTRDAELLVWTGHGWDPPRHVGTFAYSRLVAAHHMAAKMRTINCTASHCRPNAL